MIKEKNPLIINGFILKLLGILFMTLDHIGIFLLNNQNTQQIGIIFRIFGRLALPIFIFLIVESVKHTKHFGKYFLKLVILALIFMIGQIVIGYFFDGNILNFYSPILDLVFVALALYLIKRKDKISYLAILPILYILLSFIVVSVEQTKDINILWFPFFLRLPYALYDILLGLGFYFAKDFAFIFLNSNESTANLVETKYLKYGENVFSGLTVLFLSIIFGLIYKYSAIGTDIDALIIYGSVALIPLILYSGERGYNKLWFKYGCYAYVPLHILIIYLIFGL